MTKIEIALRALKRLGVVTPNDMPEPEDEAAALDTLELMMVEPDVQGVSFGWQIETVPNANTESGLPDWALFPTIAVLTLRLCDVFALTPTATQLSLAESGWQSLVNAGAMLRAPTYAFARKTPVGSGNHIDQRRFWRYIPEGANPAMGPQLPSNEGNT